MLVLYAVTHADNHAPDSLDVCRGSRAAVLYAERAERPTYQRDDVLTFARTLLELDAPHGVLPMRYGSTLPDVDSVQALLEAKEECWLGQLEWLRGHAEVIVHWEFPRQRTPAEVTGRSYLLERVDHARRSRELSEELRRSLPDLVRETRLLKGDPVRVACLVPRSAVEQLEAALGDWAGSRAGSMTLTGPWPPFSFADPTEEAS